MLNKKNSKEVKVEKKVDIKSQLVVEAMKVVYNAVINSKTPKGSSIKDDIAGQLAGTFGGVCAIMLWNGQITQEQIKSLSNIFRD